METIDMITLKSENYEWKLKKMDCFKSPTLKDKIERDKNSSVVLTDYCIPKHCLDRFFEILKSQDFDVSTELWENEFQTIDKFMLVISDFEKKVISNPSFSNIEDPEQFIQEEFLFMYCLILFDITIFVPLISVYLNLRFKEEKESNENYLTESGVGFKYIYENLKIYTDKENVLYRIITSYDKKYLGITQDTFNENEFSQTDQLNTLSTNSYNQITLSNDEVNNTKTVITSLSGNQGAPKQAFAILLTKTELIAIKKEITLKSELDGILKNKNPFPIITDYCIKIENETSISVEEIGYFLKIRLINIFHKKDPKKFELKYKNISTNTVFLIEE